jgi:branched-chain amino acid transport system substrate-binding protein
MAGATLTGTGLAGGFPAILKSRRSWAASGTVPVGSLLDRTGVITNYGRPNIAATEYAIAEINANGGLLGKQVELIQYDTQSDIAKYPQYGKKLILEDEVVVIHGGITSASREALRPVINDYKQLYFYNQAYEGGVCDKYVFLTGHTHGGAMAPLAKYSLKNFGSKCYTIAADYNFGHIASKWWDIFWRNGGSIEPVAGTPQGEHVGQVEFIPLDVTDFNATINRIQAAKPDVVMSLLVGSNHLNFYRQFTAAGLKDKIRIISTSFGGGNENIYLTPDEGQGITVCTSYFDEVDNPLNRAFKVSMKEKMGDPNYTVGEGGAETYNGWQFWARGVQAAGSFDREAVTEALEGGIEFDSPLGHVKMHPATHHVIYTLYLGEVNDKHGWNVIEMFPDVLPLDTMQVCDLIENPDQHTQYQP